VQKLIVDTNILQYAAREEYANGAARLFQTLLDRKLEAYISGYTAFEVYRGIASKKIPVTRAIVDQFTAALPDILTYKVAAILTTCYNTHEATKSYASRISDGDVVIAASAIRDQAGVLTANGNDFPRPFFTEVESFQLENSKTGAIIIAHLLEPDLSVYFHNRDICYPKAAVPGR